MPKYMLLQNASKTATGLMNQSTPEEMKKSMQEWIDWKTEAEKTVKFEFGMPLQAVARLTPSGVEESDNQASGYAMMEADSKEAVLSMLKTHPHLKRADASIDVLEIVPMPGM